MAEFEDYVIEGTNILKNKLGITDQNELKKVEEEMVIVKLASLYLEKKYGNFDSEHLKRLHRYLFGDLYEFAGKYRDVVMFKKYTSYLPYEKIPEELERVLKKYRDMDVIDSSFEIASYLANFYRELIYVHPFRDGNSRTTREFLREYVLSRFPDYELDYSKMSKEEFKLALTEQESYPTLLAYEFYKALVKKEKIK